MMTVLRWGGGLELLSAWKKEDALFDKYLEISFGASQHYINKTELCLHKLTSDSDAEDFDLVPQVIGHIDLVKPRVSSCDIDQ